MREIGGYYELEVLSGREYYPDLIAVSHARSAPIFVEGKRHK